MDASDEVLLYLVTVPYLAGFAGGFAAPRAPLPFAFFFAGAAAIAHFVWIDPPTGVAGRNVELLGTGLLWLVVGGSVGTSARSYLRRFGPLGYLYTLGVALVGIGFGELVAQELRLLVEHDASPGGIRSNVVVVVCGAGLIQLARPSPWSALKKIASVFTIWGAIELVLDRVWGDFLYSLAWFVPGTAPPEDFRAAFPLLVGAWAAVHVDEVHLDLGGRIRLDAPSGLRAAVMAEEGEPDASAVLTLPRFRAHPPPDWAVLRAERAPNHYQLAVGPELKGLAWIRRPPPRVFLNVYQYGEKDPPSADLLRRTTDFHLSGRRASKLDERVGCRHGVVSYECWFADAFLYGWVVMFVRGDSQFAIEYVCVGPERFASNMPAAECFVDSLEFEE